MPKPRYTQDPDKLRRLLAARLKELGWTNYRIAKQAGNVNDQASIARYLAGEIDPQLGTWMRWWAAMGGSVSTRTDEPKPKQ